ncbi:MAG: hypothetical protein CL685_03465 [Candidatus Magasanikbacteria bacterium]|nr:hypothetical protein [Candidatus Magasanikbacteria bacterium]|tara:strand:- start:658 stop:1713 length:1056 start_codon:yes stop_codon:yes gene_type:complete
MIQYFIAALGISALSTYFVRKVMVHYGVIDAPKKQKRKIHKKAIPLGGGLALFVSFFVVTGYAVLVSSQIGNDIAVNTLLGLFFGGAVLLVGGLLDDARNLRPRFQIIFPIIASITAMSFGIGIESVSAPGGVIQISDYNITIHGLTQWAILADFVVFFWLLGMMYTTKFLDGLDGLVVGVVGIGAIMMYFVSMQPQWFQPEVGLLALIFAGSCFGFLLWNFHPAKIFLGEGGSVFAGFTLGILAIISGSKIATTLLVMAVPILDAFRVIVIRIQKKKPIFVGDAEHIHFRLLASGLSHRKAVFVLYSIAFLFGLSTLFLQSKQKLLALILLCLLMLLASMFFFNKDSDRS